VLKTHGHAHFLPTAEGDDRRSVTHLTAYAPDGFGPPELAALNRLRDLTVGELKLRVQRIGVGRPEDFRASLFGPAREWVSATPFVAHRHLKRRGKNRDTPHLNGPDLRSSFLELALRELAARREIGTLVRVESSTPESGRPRAIDFRRDRARKADAGFGRPFGFFTLVFSESLGGPLCLGHGCHYGLGLFVPISGT
jgi:CRISPR-associated protein Csb2